MKRTTILVLNRMKIVLAILVLMADVIAVAASAMGEFYAGAFLFFLLGAVTLDYIRIARTELKAGPWYELENVEQK